MSIRRIRANSAVIEGDYVKVETYSKKFFGCWFGFALGIGAWYFGEDLNPTLLAINVTLLGLVGYLIFPNRNIRRIPKVDLVEIKEYPLIRRVTVVLDDARIKNKIK